MVNDSQLWQDVLLSHWRVSTEVVRRWLPANVELDTWEGEAWVSVVAQQVRRLSPPLVPMIRDFSFTAVDVRTYVRHEGVPAVFLFSLDVTCPRFARVARLALGLPCRRAEVKLHVREPNVEVKARRLPGNEAYLTRALVSRDGTAKRSAGLQRFFLERDALLWRRGPLLVELPFTGRTSDVLPCEISSVHDDFSASAGMLRPLGKPDVSQFCERVEMEFLAPRVILARPGIARAIPRPFVRSTAAFPSTRGRVQRPREGLRIVNQ